MNLRRYGALWMTIWALRLCSLHCIAIVNSVCKLSILCTGTFNCLTYLLSEVTIHGTYCWPFRVWTFVVNAHRTCHAQRALRTYKFGLLVDCPVFINSTSSRGSRFPGTARIRCHPPSLVVAVPGASPRGQAVGADRG